MPYGATSNVVSIRRTQWKKSEMERWFCATSSTVAYRILTGEGQ